MMPMGGCAGYGTPVAEVRGDLVMVEWAPGDNIELFYENGAHSSMSGSRAAANTIALSAGLRRVPADDDVLRWVKG